MFFIHSEGAASTALPSKDVGSFEGRYYYYNFCVVFLYVPSAYSPQYRYIKLNI
jgi:hypothetical protein